MNKTHHLPIHRNTRWSLLQLYLRTLGITVLPHQKGMKDIPFRTIKEITPCLPNWILLPIPITPKTGQMLIPCIHIWIPFVSLIRPFCLLLSPLLPHQGIGSILPSLIQFNTNHPTRIPRPLVFLWMLYSR